MKISPSISSVKSISPAVRLALAAVLIAGVSARLAVKAASLRASVPLQQRSLEDMRRNGQEVLNLRSTGAASKSVDPTSLGELERSAEASGLRSQMTSMTQNGADGLVITLEGASFNRLIAWLDDLRMNKGIRVQRAAIERAPENGTVTARVVLQ